MLRDVLSDTRLLFVRHGQSMGNLKRCFIGQGYAPLTELGHEQAEATARLLDEYRIDAIYSSDLMRAEQTAMHTAIRQGLSINTDSGLREILAGKWEGMTYSDIEREYPSLYKIWMTDTGSAQLPDGESVADLRLRADTKIREIVECNRGKTVAIFTHATPIRAMRSVWQGDDLSMIRTYGWVSNASLTEVIYKADGNTRILRFGYDDHLEGLITKPTGI